MKIIGSYIGIHDIGLSLIEDNNILACYSEERFSRIKSCWNMYTFPKNAMESLERDFNIDIKDPSIKFAAAKPVNINLNEVSDVLKNKPIKLYDHHYAHACGAYYTSGFDDDTLVVVFDGGNVGSDVFDELNEKNISLYKPFHKYTQDFQSAFYSVKNGRLIKIDDEKLIVNCGSISNIWYLMCDVFGLVGIKDEGKIMGMSPQGNFNKEIYDRFKFFINNDITKSASFIGYYYKEVLQKLNDEQKIKLKRDLAYNIQYLTENYLLDLISYANNKYGHFKNICLVGGVFANVKVNQKINEYLPFNDVWIYPAMGDEGLSLGSAIAYGVDLDVFKNRKINHVFFGKKYSSDEIDSEISSFESKFSKKLEVINLNYDYVADLLIEGKLVAVYDGSAEYGPRALGNRSIMVDPTKKEHHTLVNTRLNRDEVMPFAPIILEEELENVCHVYKSKHSAKFMTLCFKVKDEWINKIPAVINVYDNTARPQAVNKNDHKHFYNILSKFFEKTGVPVLMNTSFNGHGEPIINSPEEALKHLSEKTIDYLIINGKLLKVYV